MLLAAIYTALFTILIWKLPFFRGQISRKTITAVFLLKVMIGLLYSYIYVKHYGGGDTHFYFRDSAYIVQTLPESPGKYLYLTLGPNGGKIPECIKPQVKAMGYWGNTSGYMVVRFNALVRLFSFGEFYVHAVFMAFVSLVGLIWLHRAAALLIGNSTLLVLVVFFIPSVLFWGSGVHKEGLLLFSLGMFFWGTAGLVTYWRAVFLILMLTGAFLTYCIRDFVLLLLLPGWVVFLFAGRRKAGSTMILLSYLFFFLLTFSLPLFGTRNFLEMMAWKQDQFQTIGGGNTYIPVPAFHPDWTVLFKNLPAALRNSLLGPFFIPVHHLYQLAVVVENALLIGGMMVIPFFRKLKVSPFGLWTGIFACCLLLLIGYIVPNVGAIVRYRSIVLPFLLLPWCPISRK
ncbi:MAG: hypothetical protein KatS3mg031_0109 [Chitinophagales bacterium]|nr:MAG: hypothetical protein KatS3mg031_0109 [Chitinophagales bacterium]